MFFGLMTYVSNSYYNWHVFSDWQLAFKIRTDDMLFRFGLMMCFLIFLIRTDNVYFRFGLMTCSFFIRTNDVFFRFGLMKFLTDDISDWRRFGLRMFRTDDVSEWKCFRLTTFRTKHVYPIRIRYTFWCFFDTILK